MIDSAFLDEIRKLTDEELERRISSAYWAVSSESYGSDHEAKADAAKRHQAYVEEKNRRKARS